MSAHPRKISGVPISDALWDEILLRYTSKGLNQTAERIGIDLGIKPMDLRAAFSYYNVLKESAPVSPEAIAETDNLDELVEDVQSRREIAFHRVYEQQDNAQARRELRKLKREGHLTDVRIAQFRSSLDDVKCDPRVVQFLTRSSDKKPHPTAWLVPRFDPHFGSLVWSEDAFGTNYDTSIAAEQYNQSVEWAVQTMVDHGPVGRIYVIGGGDVLHAILSQTEAGTRLDKDTRDMRVIRTYLQCKIHEILAYHRVGYDVWVDEIPGNHDHLFATLCREYLGAYFRNVPGIIVSENLQRSTYFLHGEAAHVFDHGKRFPKSVTAPTAYEKADTVTRALMGDHYFKARHIFFYTGHLHFAAASEHGAHMEIIREPAQAPTDDYGSGLRVNSRPALRLRRLYPDGMIASEERYYFQAAE